MTNQTLTVEQKRAKIRDLIFSAESNGKFFSVVFIKKDGTSRRMTCLTGVKKHLKGGESTIAHKPNLLSVWDTEKREYRSVNLDTVLTARVSKQNHRF